MSRRTALTAIALVSIGIVFGAIIVTGFGGINLSLAGTSTRFNTTAPYHPSEGVSSLNDAFTSVAGIVTPTVVSIYVKAKPAQNPHQGFPFNIIPQDEQGQEQLQEASGSGIILTADGYILTNRHVIEGATADGIKVTLYDSRTFQAKLIGEDKNTDIAVIKIEADKLPAASLGNSDDVKVGSWVLAVGNPLGLTSTVTAGIVSAISRNIGIMRQNDINNGYGIENFIQTDAAINPGNSGGALVDLNGQVIGINTAIASSMGRYIGYGFAVPINLAKVVADALIREGKFVRGYIGVRITDLDAKGAKAYGLDRYKGVLVNSLVPGGAGEAAGLKEGDVVVEVEGKDVSSSNQLQARVGMHHPGETVKLKIWRSGKYMDVNVKLKGRDEDSDVAESRADESDTESISSSKQTTTFDKLGFSVKALDADAKKVFKRKTGVLVTDVKRYSKAEDNRLYKNIVIFEARKGNDIIPIENVPDLKKVINGLKADDAVLLRVQLENGDTAFVTLEGPGQ